MSQEVQGEKPEPSQSDSGGDAPRDTTTSQHPEAEAPEEADVMARLTGGDQQTKTEETPAGEKPAESSEEDQSKKDEKEEDSPPEKDEDFDHTGEIPEDEAKSMHDRTKKRIDKFLSERKEFMPLADWSAPKINKAAKAGIKFDDLNKGVDIMLGFLSGNDPEADKQLVEAVKSAGLIKDEPAKVVKPDFDTVRASINRMLKVDFAISEEAHAALMKTVDEAEKAVTPVVPEKKEEPAPKKEAAPQQKAPDFQQVVVANVSQRIQKLEAGYQAKHPSDWKDVRKAAYEKIGAWEKKMPAEERDDALLWPARLAEAVAEVVRERSSKKSAIRPSNSALRSSQPPPAGSKKHEPGTEEYDLDILTRPLSSDS